MQAAEWKQGRMSLPGHHRRRWSELAKTRASTGAPLAEAQTIAFGDLFLADIRAYREERLTRVGKQAIFPLWGRDTSMLARGFIAAGFEAVLVCVDPRQLDPSFAGRRFDAELLTDLRPDVDPCGANGEFRTFVHAGLIFRAARTRFVSPGTGTPKSSIVTSPTTAR